MRGTIPYKITDDMIVSSSIPEPVENEPTWDIDVTYDEFALVSVVTENSHLVYESLVSDNAGNNPQLTNSDVVPAVSAKWKYKYRTNRHRMFDYIKGDVSVAVSPFKLVLRPKKRVDTISFFDLQATDLDITVRDYGDPSAVYTLDGFLLERNVTSIYEYFFAPFVYVKKVATFNTPPIHDPIIEITLSDTSGLVEIGRLAVGQSTYLGAIQWNPVVDADNYSKIKWDEFGRAELTPIPSVPSNQQKIAVNAHRLNLVRQFRELSNAVPVVWSGLDDMEHRYTESLLIFGIYDSFQIVEVSDSFSELNLSIKGT